MYFSSFHYPTPKDANTYKQPTTQVRLTKYCISYISLEHCIKYFVSVAYLRNQFMTDIEGLLYFVLRSHNQICLHCPYNFIKSLSASALEINNQRI
jgi:hypothetical protein